MTPLTGALAGFAVLFVAVFFVSLAPYIAFLDKYGVFGSVKASVRTVSKNKLNMLIFWILSVVIVIVIGLLSLPITFNYSITSQGDPVMLILQALVSTYTTLFAYSASTNFCTVNSFGSAKGAAGADC